MLQRPPLETRDPLGECDALQPEFLQHITQCAQAVPLEDPLLIAQVDITETRSVMLEILCPAFEPVL